VPAKLALLLALIIPASLIVITVINVYREGARRRRTQPRSLEGF